MCGVGVREGALRLSKGSRLVGYRLYISGIDLRVWIAFEISRTWTNYASTRAFILYLVLYSRSIISVSVRETSIVLLLLTLLLIVSGVESTRRRLLPMLWVLLQVRQGSRHLLVHTIYWKLAMWCCWVYVVLRLWSGGLL
jgi:hypothetical protein